jgi:Na+:H+ antiporter, NhaC family
MLCTASRCRHAAMLILLAVGALIGTWILSGTVPTLIDYGLKLMHPSFFYPAACLICAIVALTIGSSWTVAGTLGVALIGVAAGPGHVAGDHRRRGHLRRLFRRQDVAAVGHHQPGPGRGRQRAVRARPAHDLDHGAQHPHRAGRLRRHRPRRAPPPGGAAFGDLPALLGAQFTLGWHLLIPLVVVFALAVKRFPAFPTILIGALLGAVFAVVFQPDVVVALADNDALSRPMALLAGAWKALFDGYSATTGNEAVDELLAAAAWQHAQHVWLVVCAMAFGAVMERTGLLERLIRSVLGGASAPAR